ncbi:MAG: phospho-N-acetylmuramoyl-pentapeptide-transferase [Clostridiales bacterium]|nr:phospho-N-acetylmuramoyl-pentapeptide-transferase [Clostridiales bacterium]
MNVNNFAILMSLVVVLLMGPVFIPFLNKLKFGQTIREVGPQSHLMKQGTPTMGGIMFIVAVLVSFIIGGFLKTPYYTVIISFLLFATIGFVDDYIKVVLKRNLGLRAYQKMAMQVLFSLIVAYITYDIGNDILIPFTQVKIHLGLWYYPFTMLFLVSIVNSVNLTDGLDGLASGLSIASMIFFAAVAYIINDSNLMNISLIFIFALVGFLYFNKYPAKVFMGDTGSLAIGGFIGGLALLTGTPLFTIIVGGVFVMETLSVVIQVTSFKLTGKRVFKMSPLHHHFELSAWSEKKIVRIFWLVGLLLSIIGIIIY